MSVKKIISCMLAAVMILSLFTVCVSADTATVHDYSTDFSDYVGEWNGTTVTTANFPTVDGGKIEPYTYNGMTSYNGITSGTPTGSSYGTSVKIYQEYYAGDTNTYGGFKYTMTNSESIDDSIYFESSVYTEPNESEHYIAKSIGFRNYGTGRTNNSVVPVLFDGSKIETFGEDTHVPYTAGKWLDFKIWLNLSEGDYKTQIWSGGEMLSEIKGTADVSSLGASVTQLIYMHRVYSEYTARWNLDEDGNAEPQITYIDNFRLQEIYGFENPDPGKLATFDFEDYTNTTNIKTGPSNGVWGTWKWGTSNSKTHGIFAEKTDRGTSLAVTSPVYEGEIGTDGAPLDTTLENGSLTVSQLKYPCAYYDLNSTYTVSDGVYLKTSIRLDDKNFGSARVNFGGINLFTVYPISADYSDGDIKIFNDSVAIDTGLNLKVGIWYDIEAAMDIATGYIIISISDGEAEFEYKGYVPEGLYTAGPSVYRLNFIHWDRTPKHDWSQPTKMLIDDVQFGSIGALYVPGEDDGEAPYDFLIDTRFTTTGYEKVINMADEVVVAFSNRVDRESFNADTVTVNGKAIDEKNIVFVDDQTLKLTFAKTQNTSYKVDFTEVADIYGNTLTDYIIFSTELQSMYISDVRYTRDGAELAKTTPGTVNVTFDGAEYDGNGTEIWFAAGVYKGGRLVSAAKDIFTMTTTETEYSLDVTIPDDNQYYVIKAFIWNAETLEPLVDMSMLTAVQKNIPVAIVKMDALNAEYDDLELYEDVKIWLEENEVKAAVGFVPRDLDSCSDEDLEAIGARVRAYYDSDFAEMWDHQYGGINCSTATYEEQIDNLQKSTDALAKIGMTYHVWGPLYNACNEYTAAALNAFPNYKVVIIRKDKTTLNEAGMLDGDNNFDVLYEYINVETGATDAATGVSHTVPMHIEEIEVEWDEAVHNRIPYLLLQWHPDYHVGLDAVTDADGVVWGGEGHTMYDALIWFKEQGATFMTPLEYVDYLKNF